MTTTTMLLMMMSVVVVVVAEMTPSTTTTMLLLLMMIKLMLVGILMRMKMMSVLTILFSGVKPKLMAISRHNLNFTPLFL